jgi:chromate reductase
MASHQQLRQSLFAVGVALLPSPEMYIGNVGDLLSPDGAVTNEKTRELLTRFMGELRDWIERILATVPAA